MPKLFESSRGSTLLYAFAQLLLMKCFTITHLLLRAIDVLQEGGFSRPIPKLVTDRPFRRPASNTMRCRGLSRMPKSQFLTIMALDVPRCGESLSRTSYLTSSYLCCRYLLHLSELHIASSLRTHMSGFAASLSLLNTAASNSTKPYLSL